MTAKIKQFLKKAFKLETYEDILVAVLRLLIVKPYFFIKNKSYKNLFKLSTYENALISTLKFLIKRSPIRLFSKKYASRHPYQSAATSLATIALVLGGAGYFLFTNYFSQAQAWWPLARRANGPEGMMTT